MPRSDRNLAGCIAPLLGNLIHACCISVCRLGYGGLVCAPTRPNHKVARKVALVGLNLHLFAVFQRRGNVLHVCLLTNVQLKVAKHVVQIFGIPNSVDIWMRATFWWCRLICRDA